MEKLVKKLLCLQDEEKLAIKASEIRKLILSSKEERTELKSIQKDNTPIIGVANHACGGKAENCQQKKLNQQKLFLSLQREETNFSSPEELYKQGLLSADKAISILEISKSKLRDLRYQGKLKVKKIDGVWFYDQKSVFILKNKE